MKIRKLHRTCAILFGPLFLVVGLSGSALIFRRTHLYGKEIKSFLVSLHTWEIIAPYPGVVMGSG